MPTILISAYDNRLFAYLMTFCLGVSWFEFILLRFRPVTRRDWTSVLGRISLGIVPTLSAAMGLGISRGFALVFVALQIRIIMGIIRRESLLEMMEELKFTVLGWLYLTGLFSLMVMVSDFPSGREAIWFLFLVVAVTDTCAYLAGRKFGKTPFFNHISPSKTWEGVYAGLIGAGVVSILFSILLPYFHFQSPNFFKALILGLALAAASIFGDLFESMLKRHFGAKDSGKLLPGHGGVLDRMDGVLFAAVPLFFFVILWGGFR